MLPKKGSGADHEIDPNIALVVSMTHRVPWRQDYSTSPRFPRAAEVVSLPSRTTSNYTNPTSPLEDTIRMAPSGFDFP